jgi:hypothetical protein
MFYIKFIIFKSKIHLYISNKLRGRIFSDKYEVKNIMITGHVQIVPDVYNDYCNAIMLSQTRIGGTKPTSPIKFREIQNASSIIKIGYFESNDLISWIEISFHQSIMRGKFWAISGLYSTRIGQVFSFNRPEIGLTIKHAFEVAEKQGYFQYFYCISEKLERVYERQWKKNQWGFNNRYDLITLDVVPANTKPTYELYWRLMGQELKPDNIAIKSRILKGYDQ